MNQQDPIIIKDLYPELSPEEQQEAKRNIQNYLCVVKKIYDRLEYEGKLKETLLRLQYEKRSRKNIASQNDIQENDDIPTSTGDSNEFSS